MGNNNNSRISVIFEEIKVLLSTIEKKLDEKVAVKEKNPSLGTTTEPKSEAKTNTIKPEQLIRLIAAHLQDSERKIGQLSEKISDSYLKKSGKREDMSVLKWKNSKE